MMVKVGDKMVISPGFDYQSPRKIVTVTKITASGQITTDDGSRWTRSRRRVGDTDRWSRARIWIATDETIRAVKEEQDRYDLTSKLAELSRREWSKAPIESVRKLADAIRNALDTN